MPPLSGGGGYFFTYFVRQSPQPPKPLIFRGSRPPGGGRRAPPMAGWGHGGRGVPEEIGELLRHRPHRAHRRLLRLHRLRADGLGLRRERGGHGHRAQGVRGGVPTAGGVLRAAHGRRRGQGAHQGADGADGRAGRGPEEPRPAQAPPDRWGRDGSRHRPRGDTAGRPVPAGALGGAGLRRGALQGGPQVRGHDAGRLRGRRGGGPPRHAGPVLPRRPPGLLPLRGRRPRVPVEGRVGRRGVRPQGRALEVRRRPGRGDRRVARLRGQRPQDQVPVQRQEGVPGRRRRGGARVRGPPARTREGARPEDEERGERAGP